VGRVARQSCPSHHRVYCWDGADLVAPKPLMRNESPRSCQQASGRRHSPSSSQCATRPLRVFRRPFGLPTTLLLKRLEPLNCTGPSSLQPVGAGCCPPITRTACVSGFETQPTCELCTVLRRS
jgi:hypothetical protein